MRGGFVLAVVVVTEQLFGFVQLYTMQVVGARAMADLRRHVFRFLHGLRLGFFDHQLVGRLVSRVTNDVDAMLELFASGALHAFGDLIKLVGIVALMLALDWKLSLIALRGHAAGRVLRHVRAPAHARSLPRHPRQDLAHERDHERAGHGHDRDPGLQPPKRGRRASSTA